jgi:hypothetical protein
MRHGWAIQMTPYWRDEAHDLSIYLLRLLALYGMVKLSQQGQARRSHY